MRRDQGEGEALSGSHPGDQGSIPCGGKRVRDRWWGRGGEGGGGRICGITWCWSGAEEEAALGGGLFFLFLVSLIWSMDPGCLKRDV